MAVAMLSVVALVSAWFFRKTSVTPSGLGIQNSVDNLEKPVRLGHGKSSEPLRDVIPPLPRVGSFCVHPGSLGADPLAQRIHVIRSSHHGEFVVPRRPHPLETRSRGHRCYPLAYKRRSRRERGIMGISLGTAAHVTCTPGTRVGAWRSYRTPPKRLFAVTSPNPIATLVAWCVYAL